MTTPTTPDQGDERRAFESAIRQLHPEWSFTTDPVFGYHNERTRCAWEAWQAARALSAAQPVAQEAIPPGYVLISIDALRVWGKLDEVQDACKYSLAAPQPSQGAEAPKIEGILRKDAAHQLACIARKYGSTSTHERAGLLAAMRDAYLLGQQSAAPHPPASAEADTLPVGWLPSLVNGELVVPKQNSEASKGVEDDPYHERSMPFVKRVKRPSESVSVSGEVSGAVARIEQYVARRTGRRGLDPDVVVGIDADIELCLSDLRAVLALAGSGGKE